MNTPSTASCVRLDVALTREPRRRLTAGVGVAEVGEPVDLGGDMGELLDLGRAEARVAALRNRHLPTSWASGGCMDFGSAA